MVRSLMLDGRNGQVANVIFKAEAMVIRTAMEHSVRQRKVRLYRRKKKGSQRDSQRGVHKKSTTEKKMH